MSVWPNLSKEERVTLTMQEENAIKNQIILFINRIINMRTPVDFSEGELSSCKHCVAVVMVARATVAITTCNLCTALNYVKHVCLY